MLRHLLLLAFIAISTAAATRVDDNPDDPAPASQISIDATTSTVDDRPEDPSPADQIPMNDMLHASTNHGRVPIDELTPFERAMNTWMENYPPPSLFREENHAELLARWYSEYTFKFRIQDQYGGHNEDQNINAAKSWARSIGDENAAKVRHVQAILWLMPHISFSGEKTRVVVDVSLTWDGKQLRAKLEEEKSDWAGDGMYLPKFFDGPLANVNAVADETVSAKEQLAAVFECFRETYYLLG